MTVRLLHPILLLSFFAGIAYGGIPPEVPQNRTYQILSPFYFDFHDDGESVIQTEGPACQSYSQRFPQDVAIEDDNPLTTGFNAVTVNNLVGMLSRGAGLLFWSSHSTDDGDPALALEAFPKSFEGPEDAANTIAFYEQVGLVQSGELKLVLSTWS